MNHAEGAPFQQAKRTGCEIWFITHRQTHSGGEFMGNVSSKKRFLEKRIASRQPMH